MDSDVSFISGSGGGIGWAFLLIFLAAGVFYKYTTSYERYQIKQNILLVFGVIAILAGLVEIFGYLFG